MDVKFEVSLMKEVKISFTSAGVRREVNGYFSFDDSRGLTFTTKGWHGKPADPMRPVNLNHDTVWGP